jgi:hypothetical protein
LWVAVTFSEHDVHSQGGSTPPGNPQQFGVIGLFAVVTLPALVAAMAAPFLREMQAESRVRVLGMVTCQLLVTAGADVNDQPFEFLPVLGGSSGHLSP